MRCPRERRVIREARPLDYAAIAALNGLLGVPEPVADDREWEREHMPWTVVVEEDGRVAGYALFRVFGVHGHVTQIVVAPDSRRRGHAASLMAETARRLRAAGCTRWHLNVKEDNLAARALYDRLGFGLAFAAQSLRLAPEVVTALPVHRGVHVTTAPETEAAALEGMFGLSAGALLRRRGVTLRADIGTKTVGVARLAPVHARAAPFRLRDHRAARPFFVAMQRWIDVPSLRVVVEGDARLTDLLLAAGGVEELRLLHLEGKL